jgi:ferredoxin
VTDGNPRRVQVDQLSCEGHGRCQNAAPEVFRLDDEDISHVILDPVPANLQPNVDRAIRLCPRQAVTWVEAE